MFNCAGEIVDLQYLPEMLISVSYVSDKFKILQHVLKLSADKHASMLA